MAKTKIIEVSITSLKITAEDNWLKKHIKEKGARIDRSPQFQYLWGHPHRLLKWMRYRKLPYSHISVKMMSVLRSLVEHGQLEPIKIYDDMRINTGHKRAACMRFLGYVKIKAVIVPDDYKL